VSGLVEVARFTTRTEADLARLLLGSAGIEAILFDAEMNPFLGDPVRIMVLEADLELAREVLAES
jgi:hypothetical protein